MAKAFDASSLKEPLVELIRRCSCDLPEDVERALIRAREEEREGTPGHSTLAILLENVHRARVDSVPICQDTGTNIYEVDMPPAVREAEIGRAVAAATREATRRAYLRPNVVDSRTGEAVADNVGIGNPQVQCHQWNKNFLRIGLMLKGGGCENCTVQYALPDAGIRAGRDLRGVERCVIETVVRAQGQGCAPGVLGVGIGGDRVTSHAVARAQLWRTLDDRNTEPELAAMEHNLLPRLNSLGIGPMGFGGRTTAIGLKVGHAHRLPASYFVTVAYMCWACRRHTLVVRPDGRHKVE